MLNHGPNPSRAKQTPDWKTSMVYPPLNRLPLLARLAATCAALACLAAAAQAEPVTLTTNDGTYSVTGELTETTDEAFTIKSNLGVITIRRDTVSCTGAACPEGSQGAGSVNIVGDRALGLGLLPILLRQYAELQGGSTTVLETLDGAFLVELAGGSFAETAAIKIVPTVSAEGISALLEGKAEMALADRRALTREVRAAANLDLGDLQSQELEQIIALDGLVFLTHPTNPVRSITIADASLIFAGVITNWAEVGGPDQLITVYTSTPDLGSAEVMESLVMRPKNLKVTPNAKLFGSDRVVADAIAKDPSAIGYARIGNDAPARAMSIRGTCGIQTLPTPFTVKTEEYPLTRQLYLYRTQKPLSDTAQAFSDFLRSDRAQIDVSDAGFVDQAIITASTDEQTLRLASAMLVGTDPALQSQLRTMVDSLANARQLSATFRYETGTDSLNARALTDLDRLGAMLSSAEYKGKDVMFLGFTDAVGNDDLNTELSQDRAEQVISALLQKYPDLVENVRLSAVGYGEVMSLACNDTDTGRAINRRVEVWVKDGGQ
jgi:phosphate transport system substrate-binding protein